MADRPAPSLLRFGVFEVNLRTGELRKSGALVKLQQQPFRVLAALARRPGELVTREELRNEVWGEETFVDFEQGLNFCIKQVRAALGDQADTPRYVETLPRRGYRFIAPVEGVAAPAAAEAEPGPPAARSGPRLARRAALVLISVSALLALAQLFGRGRAPASARQTGRVRLAVLPFQDLGSDPEQEYFGEGLTEEMIAQLGRLQPERLAVIARTSAMKYKDPVRDIAAIGRDLDVGYVVEGSVRYSAGRVRITAKLIQTSDQTQLWSETYERDLQDMLELQSEVARAIAAGIQLTLTPQAEARLARVARLDPEAYELYLRGRFSWNKRDAPGLRRSIEYFERAIARRPDYALAHVGIADAYIVLADQGNLSAREALPRARAAALRALEIDPSLAEAHASLAMVRGIHDWDWAGSEKGFRRAIELNPSYATAHHWFAHLLRALGRFAEAVAETRRAQELDPLSLIINSNVGSALFYAGRHDEAAAQYRRTLQLNPDWAPAHWGLGRTLRQQGRVPESLAEHAKAVAASRRDAGYVCTLANALALADRRAEAQELLEEMEQRARSQYVSPYDLALVHAGLGDHERALAALEQAYTERHSSLRQLRVDERLDPIRADPRFESLARRVGLYPWPLPAPS
jgi:TolB-like protein/DNA-binding winged helix-turn-helix (wHTH) protein/Tfp pilus assembly protein PilF